MNQSISVAVVQSISNLQSTCIAKPQSISIPIVTSISIAPSSYGYSKSLAVDARV